MTTSERPIQLKISKKLKSYDIKNQIDSYIKKLYSTEQSLVKSAIDLSIESHCLPQFRNEPTFELKHKIIYMVLSSGDSYVEQHLLKVVKVAHKFENYIDDKYLNIVIASCWLHDSIEDGRLTFNDIKKQTNEEVAEIVYRLSNYKGKTRDERANDEYYEKIKECSLALFVKLCDRIANVEDSLESDNMFEKYKKEYPKFKEKLSNKDLSNYQDMWSLLDNYLIKS